MKEYTWIRTRLDSSFSREVNSWADKGWRVVHIDIWRDPVAGVMFPVANVFFERDKKVASLEQGIVRKLKIGDEVDLVMWRGGACLYAEQSDIICPYERNTGIVCLHEGKPGIICPYEEKTGIVATEETLGGLRGLFVDGYKYIVYVPVQKCVPRNPVEERAPYYIARNAKERSFDICFLKDGLSLVHQSFPYAVGKHESDAGSCNAKLMEVDALKAAIEACDSLNAAYNKEHTDDQDNTN